MTPLSINTARKIKSKADVAELRAFKEWREALERRDFEAADRAKKKVQKAHSFASRLAR